jgi:carbonic anhydrase
MDSLEDGIRKFQRDVFPKRREEFRLLAEGQSPDALFVGCSDSRVDPNLLTQTSPGGGYRWRELTPNH